MSLTNRKVIEGTRDTKFAFIGFDYALVICAHLTGLNKVLKMLYGHCLSVWKESTYIYICHLKILKSSC